MWVRLYITVEGQTERAFAEQALKPHLAGFQIDVRSRVVVTNRKLGKRGGNSPIYERDKVRVGAPAAVAIGLQMLRSRCPHFGDWLSRLEALGTTISAA